MRAHRTRENGVILKADRFPRYFFFTDKNLLCGMIKFRDQFAKSIVIALALAVGIFASGGRTSSEPAKKQSFYGEIEAEKLAKYLGVLVVRSGLELPEKNELPLLNHRELARVFYEVVSRKLWQEAELARDESLLEIMTLLTLEFLPELMLWYDAVPDNARNFAPTEPLTSGRDKARANYANLTRVRFKVSRLYALGYPRQYFAKLRDEGLAEEYPPPRKDLERHSYAVRVLYMLLNEDDKTLVENWLNEVIAGYLDLAWQMRTIGPESIYASRILSKAYLKRLEGKAR